ncbi:MAG TPA: hypothetical protein VFS12_11090 [Terriglobia bacterium]|nr:hypothetical protein [Terriglobia bacterium]
MASPPLAGIFQISIRPVRLEVKIQRLSCDQVGAMSSDASEVIRRVTAILAFAYHHFWLHLAKPLEVFGESLTVFLRISALRACYNTVIEESRKDSAEESGARRVFVGSAAIMAFGIGAQPPPNTGALLSAETPV